MSNFIFTSCTNKSQCDVTLVGVTSFAVLSQNSFVDLVTTSLELPHLNNNQKKSWVVALLLVKRVGLNLSLSLRMSKPKQV
ncbi:hypothetical protein [Nostoc sp.]|uniref:hypothetical protein n=1 Tax=Nostoc sp. TaxID=1180 RepID=UPI002FF4E34C